MRLYNCRMQNVEAAASAVKSQDRVRAHQVGGVDGEEDEGERRPDVSHEPGGVTSWAIDINRRLKEDSPDQPQCS